MEKPHSLVGDFEYDPDENPDWSFARNVRATLLTPSTEWVQSVCSFPFEVNGKTFITPNRDYPYEGLVAYHEGENWKFIDCVALSLQLQNGGELPLTPAKVKINPWRVEYRYDGEVPVSVSYYLDSQNSPELLTGCVEFHFPRGLAYGNDRVIPVIQPFVDIRHMWGSSRFQDYRITTDFEDPRRIQISNCDRVLTVFSSEGRLSIFPEPEIVNWEYKLGTGNRTESFSHDRQQKETTFVGERKDVAAFFNLQIPTLSEQKSLKLYFIASRDTTSINFSVPDIQKNSDESKTKDQSDLQTIIESCPISEEVGFREEIWARIVALTKFKTYIPFAEQGKHIRVPHAGAWWFRTPWYRDVFEGLLNSFETLMRIPQERKDIKGTILSALSLQNKTSGLILNKLPEFTDQEAQYNSCDATLLCLIVANAYFSKTKDPEFASRVLACVETAVSSFKTNGKRGAPHFELDGAARIDELTGLLLCAPHHSWIDTRTRSIEYAGHSLEHLPNRLSIPFLNELRDRTLREGSIGVIASSPCFFLPEINAQWINALAGTVQTIDLLNGDRPSVLFDNLRVETEALLSKAKRHFKSLFWNEKSGYLFNAVFEDTMTKDDIECETGVTAAAMLGETVFTRDELQSIWNYTKRKLLAYRRLIKYGEDDLPFGVLTKIENQRVYYGDDQYHSDMIWPRSTPYLIRLLRLLNRDDIVRDILINNLDHQMTECAIFYNQELFSPASGHNAHPNGTTSQNPVPVKNPIQFWSQWCDAYLELFGKE